LSYDRFQEGMCPGCLTLIGDNAAFFSIRIKTDRDPVI